MQCNAVQHRAEGVVVKLCNKYLWIWTRTGVSTGVLEVWVLWSPGHGWGSEWPPGRSSSWICPCMPSGSLSTSQTITERRVSCSDVSSTLLCAWPWSISACRRSGSSVRMTRSAHRNTTLNSAIFLNLKEHISVPTLFLPSLANQRDTGDSWASAHF